MPKGASVTRGYNADKMKVYLREYMFNLAEQKGNQVAIKKAKELLETSTSEQKKQGLQGVAPIFRGELAEVLLELYLRDYAKKHKGTFYVKGLCFKRPDGKQEYTELDLVLFTKARIYFFESKSYSGQKTLTGECTIERKGFSSFDVYKQNRMHLDNFMKYTGGCKLLQPDSKKLFKLVYWDYSLDGTVDKRDSVWKKRMPHITDKNIEKFLLEIEENREKNWDTKKLFSKVKEMHADSEKNFKKHVKNMQKR